MQEPDRERAVGMLLDFVSDKLDGGDRTAFSHIICALVRTEQLQCARMLDEELTEQYLMEDREPEPG